MATAERRLVVSFGALSRPLAVQLAGVIDDPKQIAVWQSHSDSLLALMFARVLTEGDVHKARTRIMKQIREAALQAVKE